MKAGHAGKTGRDSAIEEIALDYAFALKISGKLNSKLENLNIHSSYISCKSPTNGTYIN